jgi:hypothetical protein
MTIGEADARLILYRNAALTVYARQLLADGADVEDEVFREKMLRYARQLEDWRTVSMAHIREYAAAAKAQRDEASTIH